MVDLLKGKGEGDGNAPGAAIQLHELLPSHSSDKGGMSQRSKWVPMLGRRFPFPACGLGGMLGPGVTIVLPGLASLLPAGTVAFRQCRSTALVSKVTIFFPSL